MLEGQGAWSSLDIAKLAIQALTPLFVLLLGIWASRVAKRFEALQWASQKVVERRLATFDQAAPLLNDLYCFFTYVGNWKEITPPNVIRIKRELDKIVYVSAALFSPDFLQGYFAFIHLCFKTYSGWAKDAQLRTSTIQRREGTQGGWKTEWNSMFVGPEDESPVPTIREKYEELMTQFAAELGVPVRAKIRPTEHRK